MELNLFTNDSKLSKDTYNPYTNSTRMMKNQMGDKDMDHIFLLSSRTHTMSNVDIMAPRGLMPIGEY